MRIKVMIEEDKSNWYFNKFFLLLLLKKYKDSKWETQFWYHGLKGQAEQYFTRIQGWFLACSTVGRFLEKINRNIVEM